MTLHVLSASSGQAALPFEAMLDLVLGTFEALFGVLLFCKGNKDDERCIDRPRVSETADAS